MTALSLRIIAADALADIGMASLKRRRLGAVRETAWSSRLPGFGVRSYASGREMYVVQTRMGGRVRTVTLCNVRLISRRDALDLGRRILLRAQVDENPADARQRIRSTPSFEKFLDLYWERMSQKWKSSTLATHNTYRRRCLDGAFGRRGVEVISQAHVAAWFALTAERLGEGGANRAMDLLRAIFGKAEAWGMRPPSTNPTTGIKRFPRKRRARFLREEELRRLGDALRQEAAEYPVHVAAIQLLLLTGCRSSEITGLQWSEVVGSRLRLTDSKTGPRTVWLGAEACALLRQLPHDVAQSHVFCREESDKPVLLKAFWTEFRQRHGFEGLRIHDLRHYLSFRTMSCSFLLDGK